MRPFFRNFAWFCLPFCMGLMGIWLLPDPKSFGYHQLKNDCENKAAWMYDSLNHNQKPLDVVFLGSSHTLNAVQDSLVQLHYQNLTGKLLHIANWGFCSFGNNLTFTYLKDILFKKNPKKIIVEIRMDEVSFGHRSFAYVANREDVWELPKGWHKDYLKDLFQSSSTRWEAVRQKWLFPDSICRVSTRDFGHRPHHSIASMEVLKEAEKNSQKRLQKVQNELLPQLNYLFSWSYLQKISDLAKTHNADLYFLYLPDYGSSAEPIYANVYKEYGQILIPPDSLLKRQDTWADAGHFGIKGAENLAKWLAQNLANLP